MKKIVLCAVATALIVTAGWTAAKNTGVLKTKEVGTIIELQMVAGQKIDVTWKGISLNEGTYKPENYFVMRQAKDGTVWKLEGVKKQLGDLASITVTKGQTTEIDAGGPVTLKPFVYRSQQTKTGDTVVPVSFTQTGKNGELYMGGATAGLKKAPLPYFQIIDSNKKVLAEGQFEYG